MDKKIIAENLLRIKAVFLRPDDPFTWASGIKSPIYCDNRLILTAPDARDIVEKALAEEIRDKYPDAEVLMGTATAGIAHAAICADILGLPMGYVRGSAKDHGRGNRIEGELKPGEKAVVVEDLVSTAGSCIDAVEALRTAGAEVIGVISIFTYGMEKSIERFEEAGVRYTSLLDLDTLIETALEEGYIDAEAKEKLLAFRDDPKDESWMEGGRK